MDGDFQPAEGSYFDEFELPVADAAVVAGLAAAERAAVEVGAAAAVELNEEDGDQDAAAAGAVTQDLAASSARAVGQQEAEAARGTVGKGDEKFAETAAFAPAVVRGAGEQDRTAGALFMEQGDFHTDGDFAAAAADSRAACGEADAFLLDGGYEFSGTAFVHADYGDAEEQQQQEMQQKRYYGDSSYMGGGGLEEQEGERGGHYTAPTPPTAAGANRTESQASPGAAGATKKLHVGMVNGYSNDVSSSVPAASSSASEGLYSSNSDSGPAGAMAAGKEVERDSRLYSLSTPEDDSVDAAARQAVEALHMQMQQEVEARRKGEAQQKKEQRELAQEELQEFYQRRKQQIERRRKANQLKESEEAEREEGTQKAGSSGWSRVIQLIEADDRSSKRSSCSATTGTTDKKTGGGAGGAAVGSASTASGGAPGGGGSSNSLKERYKMKELLLELSAQEQGKACS